MIIYVIELQSGIDTGSAIPMSYDNRSNAEEKYHDILKYASKSSVHIHGAVMLNEDGQVIKQEAYYHGSEPEE